MLSPCLCIGCMYMGGGCFSCAQLSWHLLSWPAGIFTSFLLVCVGTKQAAFNSCQLSLDVGPGTTRRSVEILGDRVGVKVCRCVFGGSG